MIVKSPLQKDVVNILIIDDHPIVREGLTQLINREKDLKVCGEAEDKDDALTEIAEKKPNFVILDISLKTTNGIDVIQTLKTRYPKIPVLVLSMHDEILYAERVLHAGARGYIMKGEVKSKLLVAIRRVLNGDIYVGDRVAEKVVSQLATGSRPVVPQDSLSRLSNRELEIFEYIGNGFKTRKIAETLCLSMKTVNTYREHIKQKLGLESAIDLIRHAVHWVDQQPQPLPAKRK